MNFTEFCNFNGLDVINPKISNLWQRCSTFDHPHKKNGAYIFDGTRGACQNWATDIEVNIYTPTGVINHIDLQWLKQQKEKQKADKEKLNVNAAKKAEFIISQSKLEKHDYLTRKGFPDMKGLVYENKLIIPMFDAGKLAGCQSVDIEGNKKFLFGQKTSYVTHRIGTCSNIFVCEGYATGLSVQAALRSLNIRYTIHICFSAGNISRVYKNLDKGVVIADHDKSGCGEKVAKETGWPYFMSDIEGEDINDMHQRLGVFQASQLLRKFLESL